MRVDGGNSFAFDRVAHGAESGRACSLAWVAAPAANTSLTVARIPHRRFRRRDAPAAGSETQLGPRRSAGHAPLPPPWTGRAVEAGQMLGPYRTIERLGQGRQADVWRALRVVPPFREVALKVLPASASAHDPRRRAQLRHEAERGARFADPALLPACDFGESSGFLFLAMPLVVGCTLGDVLAHRRDRLAGRPTPPAVHALAAAPEPAYTRAVAALMTRIARAVSTAHAAQVVHRDIKPMNILVCRDLDPRADTAPGGAPGAYLCDFGLARDLDVATPWQLRDGAGSPLYMAPERLLKQPADEIRCDVYALGVTLFEALTLEPPVDVPPELSSGEWAAYLAAVEPRRAGAVRPDLPGRIEDVVHRAMARDPARRYPTAAHFADALARASG